MKPERRHIFYLVAIAFGLLMLIPTSGMLSAQAATPSEMVLVDADHLGVMKQLGGEIFVDYNNGFYLLKVPATANGILSQADFPMVKMSEYRTLDFYPSAYKFNPVNGIPDISSQLRASSDNNVYVIQFVGPVKQEWVKTAENYGAHVYTSIAKYGIIAKMSPDAANAVKAMPEVAWVGAYEPAYKITSDADINSDTKGTFEVWVFDKSTLQSLADELSAHGVTVLSIQSKSIIISVEQNKLPTIASLSEVQTIEKYNAKETMDLQADRVIHVREMWYPAYTGISTKYIGEGQVVGIQDTGLDEGGKMDLSNDEGPNDLTKGPLGERIVRYKDQGGSSDPDGENIGVAHGSHCCGLIAGNGYSFEAQFGYSTDDYNWDHAESVGSAPGAKLSVDGIVSSSGNGYGLSPNANYWDTEQNDGAYIYTNSWGSQSPGDYGNEANDVDDKTHSDNGRLFFFAASNAGPQRDTLSPESQGKNGICVAASRNLRPDQFDASNPNTITDFSSRGGTYSDTRIKPDLAAPGTADLSLYARGEWDYHQNNDGGNNPEEYKGVDQYDWSNRAPGQDGHPDYQWMQGTSMATPVAAGSAAVVRQYLIDHEGINNPNSQLIKALMINGARRLPNINYPGYDQGWGLINVKNSLMPDPPTKVEYAEDSMSSTGTWDAATDGGMSLDVASSDVPLKVTLVWVDSKGKDLSNDLNLYVEAPDGQTWYHGNAYGTDGWTVPNAKVNDTADKWLGQWDSNKDGYDNVNNVEQVEVQYPATGTWTIHVIGYNVPETVPFALVVRADIGSLTPSYSVKAEISGSTTITVAQGGSAEIPVTIQNYGTSADTIGISDNVPSGLSTTYTYGGVSKTSYALSSGESATLVMTISVGSSTSPGVYPFHIAATSSNDASATSVIDLKVQVIDSNEKIPLTFMVTNGTADEYNPSVTAFTDGSGTSWVFIAYTKSTPVDGKNGGDKVMVKYAQLDSNGLPTTWNGPIQISSELNEQPNDLRILHGEGGTYADWVWVVWTGTDPNAASDSNGDKGSWGRIAWAEAGNYGSWHAPVTIDENSGAQTYNYKRVNSIQYRASAHELVYIFEHLDYDSNGQIKEVHNGYCSSTDGGATWSSASDYDPGGDYFFFPNIMDGGTDYNDVVWSYVYHRGSSGADRDLSCMVYDGSWGGDSGGATKETDVLDNDNNLMFPVVAYDKSSGSANRVFFAVLDDTNGPYQIRVGHHDGTVSSGSPPADTSDAWGTEKGPFATSVSDANYNRRPLMNMISTPDDGGMWVQYMEKSNPLGVNMVAMYSDDQFGSVSYHAITSNSYAKGHQMSSSAAIGSTDYVYTTYEMSKGDLEDVNYDVYLAVYHKGYENDPDTQAPKLLRVASTPTIYDSSDGTYDINLKTNPSFDVVATADDSDTGRSGISSAYWMESDTSVTDPTTLDWTSATAMDMNAHTAVEKVSYVLNPCWQNNTVHRIWIKATDSAGNDGYSYIDLKVTGVPTMTVSFDNGWNLISLPWLSSPTSLSDTLNGISWDRAMVYQNGHWYTYNTARDAKFNIGFPMIDNTMGLWVHTTSAGSITKEMQCLGTTSISLHKGWNLIGYPSKTMDTVSSIMSGFTGQYDIIEMYDPASGDIVALSSSDNMEYGNGYWVHVTAPGTLTVNW